MKYAEIRRNNKKNTFSLFTSYIVEIFLVVKPLRGFGDKSPGPLRN